MIAAAALLGGAATAQEKGVNFEPITLEQALEKARQTGKPVFLDCYTTWCGPCKRMTGTVFPQEHVGNYFNANFVNIKIDMEKGEGLEVRKRYGVRAYPTFLILDGQGNEISRVIGSDQPDPFIAKVQNALKPENNLHAMAERYRSGDQTVLESYVGALALTRRGREALVILEENFAKMDDQRRFQPKFWEIYAANILDLDDPVMAYASKNYRKLYPICGKEKVDSKLGSLYLSALKEYFSGKRPMDKKAFAAFCKEASPFLQDDDLFYGFLREAAPMKAAGEYTKLNALLQKNFEAFTQNDKSFVVASLLRCTDLPADMRAALEQQGAKLTPTDMQVKVNLVQALKQIGSTKK